MTTQRRAEAIGLDLRGAALMALLGTVLVAIDLVDIWGQGTRGPSGRWWHLVPLLLLCAVMVWRRVRPLTCLALGVVVFAVETAYGGSIGSLLVIIELVYAAGLHGRGRAVVSLDWAIGIGVAASGLAVWALTGDLQDGVLTALTVFAVFGTSFWWGRSSRRSLDLLAAQRRQAQDEARLAELRAREERRGEREQMARDLHDALSGSLAAITIHAEAGLHDERSQRRALEVVRATSKDAVRELQSMLAVLRPDVPMTVSPSLADLPALVEHSRSRGIEVALHLDPDPLPELPAPTGQALYRVLQEALHNVARHAASPRAEVAVAVQDDLVLTVVSPLPPGPDRDEPGLGLGLRSMHERVEALGGHLEAGPSGDSWRVRATVPLHRASTRDTSTYGTSTHETSTQKTGTQESTA